MDIVDLWKERRKRYFQYLHLHCHHCICFEENLPGQTLIYWVLQHYFPLSWKEWKPQCPWYYMLSHVTDEKTDMKMAKWFVCPRIPVRQRQDWNLSRGIWAVTSHSLISVFPYIHGSGKIKIQGEGRKSGASIWLEDQKWMSPESMAEGVVPSGTCAYELVSAGGSRFLITIAHNTRVCQKGHRKMKLRD